MFASNFHQGKVHWVIKMRYIKNSAKFIMLPILGLIKIRISLISPLIIYSVSLEDKKRL